MNRRIYYDGALINKIGIDRIVIKKVVLKEINAEKLDTALTCCAIHYDKVIVEGRQFYLTEKDNKFNYLKIDDNELGTLTFGVKNKQYGIYQFSPKEMWGGTNLVNYSAKEIHEFIEDAKIKLKDKYGLEVDFDDSEIREIELNTTFATKHKFSAYRRAITVMLFIMPYLKKDDVRSEKYRKTEEKLISSETVYNKQLFYRPFDALKATRPVVIIDEPHRFSREQKAYKAIVEELSPQIIIRYGATFPDVTVGKGRNKVIFKDFNNLVYELNACDSFNLNLIKGIAKEHFEPLSKKEEKVKLLSVESKTSATFQFKKRGEETKTYTLTPGDSLSVIDSSFEGLTISARALPKEWNKTRNNGKNNSFQIPSIV